MVNSSFYTDGPDVTGVQVASPSSSAFYADPEAASNSASQAAASAAAAATSAANAAAAVIDTTGAATWSPASASINIDTYGSGSSNGLAAWKITNGDSSAVTGKERHTLYVENTSAGTGDGTVPGTTYALGVSMLKQNWTTTTTAGQTLGMVVVARGGRNNAIDSGDVAAINANVGASYSNNLSQLFEGVSGYYPAGAASGSIALDVQVGSIRAAGLGDVGNNPSYGYFAQAQNGGNGVAFGASNLKAAPKYGNAATWNYFLKYDNDDGVNAAYTSFAVTPAGWTYLAGPGASSTNSKIIRVGAAVTNNLEIVNSAGSAVIANLDNSGNFDVAGAYKIGGNTVVDNAAWTAYTPTLTPGSGSLTSASATGRYKRIGKTVFVQFSVTITTVGTAAGVLNVSLPVNIGSSYKGVLMGREDAATGALLVAQMLASASSAVVLTAASATPIVAGYVLDVSGVYESV